MLFLDRKSLFPVALSLQQIKVECLGEPLLAGNGILVGNPVFRQAEAQFEQLHQLKKSLASAQYQLL